MTARPLSLVSLVTLLAACTRADDTSLLDRGTPPTYAPAPAQTTNQTSPAGSLLACNQVRRPPLQDCSRSERARTGEDAVALGFDADTFVELISGEHRSQLAWQLDGAGSDESTELVLTVEPLGEVRFVDLQASSPGRREVFTYGNTGATYYTCGDRFAVDAQLRLVSSDGALNEVVNATLEADSGRYARSVVQLQIADLAGSLRTTLEAAGGREPPDALTLVLGISELGSGLEGSLAAHVALDQSNVETGAACDQLGTLSLGSSCPLGAFELGADDELLGLSFASALERLNATSPALLHDTGAQLTLGFEASPTSTCISIDTPASLPAILLFPGTAQLASSDGRVGGSMDVQLSAEALAGTFHRVTAQTEYLVPDPSGLSELAPSYAILEPLVWSDEYLGGFEFRIEATEQSSGGLLRAIGGNFGCSGSRPCVCPGSGCTVTNAEKWAVRWGNLAVGTELPLQTPTAED